LKTPSLIESFLKKNGWGSPLSKNSGSSFEGRNLMRINF
jgi:hypothetical protein